MSQTLPVTFRVSASSVGKMRCELDVSLEDPAGGVRESWQMATDEGDFHGGDGTAPSPLAYFTGALAACLMTQIRAFAKRLNVSLDGVTIEGAAHWQAHLSGRKPYTTEPLGFDLDVKIDSNASTAQLAELVRAAKKGCFIEQTLSRTNVVNHQLIHDGETIPIKTD